MKLKVNNKDVEVEEGCTVGQLVDLTTGTTAGVAIAVNSKIVKRPEWSNYELKEGDNVLLIQAAYGG